MLALEEIRKQLNEEKEERPRTYTTRTWGEIARICIPHPTWFLGQCFALGHGRVRLHVIFGQGGLGKSRIAMNIARNQVLGLPFGGLDTGNEPLRHLMMGTENGIQRLQKDIRRMSAGLSAEQLETLEGHIALATLEAADDAYVTLSDPLNIARWRATIEERRPQVLWIDPWGDVQVGDANAESDARYTLSELSRILGEVECNAAMVVLAHARTGVRNIMEAVGYDGANFGKGSKALYSCARAVLNLAPGNEEESPPILIACPKNNDGPRPISFALKLDPETMTYREEPDFDVESWIEEIRDRSRGRRRQKARIRVTEEQALEVLGTETETAGRTRMMLRDAGATRDEADDLVKRLVAAGQWEQWRPPGKNQPTYIGTEAAMKYRREKWAEQQQRKMVGV
jgi:hypothetical protein